MKFVEYISEETLNKFDSICLMSEYAKQGLNNEQIFEKLKDRFKNIEDFNNFKILIYDTYVNLCESVKK